MSAPTMNKLRTKNQVTVPASMADQFGLRVGEPVRFTIVDGGILMSPVVDHSDEWITPQLLQELDHAFNEPNEGPAFDDVESLLADMKG